MALVLPVEDFGGRSSVLLAVAFLEIGLRLSLDSRLPEVADSILIQDMVNYLFYTLLLLTVESGVLYFVLIRILGACDENPPPMDSCVESDLDRRARKTAHVTDGIFAVFAVCPLVWVAWKIFEADKALKMFEADRDLKIKAADEDLKELKQGISKQEISDDADPTGDTCDHY
jgi:hypothetical protein